MTARNPDPGFWRGRRVLLTGHTGFKGAWTALWLSRLGAVVSGLALPPESVVVVWSLIGEARGTPARWNKMARTGVVSRGPTTVS